MKEETRRLWEKWIASRPASVQALAREFPAYNVYKDSIGKRFYVIGYTEEGDVILTRVNPNDDYAAAMSEASHIYVPATELREITAEHARDAQ